MDRLELFFSRMAAFLDKSADAPMQMWAQTANEPGNRVMLLVFLAAFAGGALYLVISFLKATWRGKLRMLSTALFCVLIVLTVFWFALM